MRKIKGIASRTDFGGLLKDMNLNGYGAEIGVYKGDFSEILLQTSSLKKLYLVDPWRFKKHGEECYQLTKKKFAGEKRVEIVRQLSEKAYKLFGDGYFDFIYVDANHDCDHISRDLRCWFSKVRMGGVFAGHDFFDRLPEFCVQRTVESFATEIRLPIHVTTQDRNNSWYFIKLHPATVLLL